MGSMIRRLLLGSLVSAASVTLLSAQHSGGHASGHASFSSGGSHIGGSGFHTSSPSFRGSGYGFGNSFSGATRLPPAASGISPLAWSQIQRGNRFGYRRIPYGYFFAPYYYPFLGYDTSTYPSYSDQAAYADDYAMQSMLSSQGALSQQMQMLSDQVNHLRNAQQQGRIPEEDPQNTAEVPVTVVLRNGQQIQVQNYAVMGQTFWDFTRQPARKIPISSIDIAASTRATEAKGGEFPQLTATP